MTEPDPGGTSPNDNTKWQLVRALFDRAAEMTPDERATFLDEIEDKDIRVEVESLLGADEEEDDFLETPAARVLTDPPITPGVSSENLAGDRVGAYVLLRLVGSGGMGVVYEAERADRQYRHRVAVKLMRRSISSEMVIERFKRERQILAGLDHPGIARLIDGGVTDEGQPYYVMEFIDGVPITEYCDARDLGLSERLDLFREVCDAVSYAHRNLVVHRDLKPGNILVTDEGRVKLLDFGIAKLISSEGPGEQTLTLVAGRMLTPGYSSPEQVQGEQVTTATDVYSLGVVLYELLTGRRPFDFDTPSLKEAIDEMVAAEPTRPSDAITEATAPRVGTHGWRSVRRALEGELDNVVLMALHKEPGRRYQSVQQLSDDIVAHQEGRPVRAQRDSTGYRARKFVTRNRTGALALAAALVLLLAGLAATLVQARRADRERAIAEARAQDARELANALLFDVHNAIADLPGATAARELVVTRGLEYLDELAAQATGDRRLKQEVASAYLQFGLVQGTPSGASLGRVSQAEMSFERALTLADELVTQAPTDDVARRTLALAHEKLGDVMAYRGAVEEGVGHARQALALWSYFAESQPEQERSRLSAVISHVKLGDLLGNPNFNNLGDAQGAIGEYQYSLNLLEHPVLASSEDGGVIRYRGLVHERLGSMLRQQDRQEEALDTLEEALEIRIDLASDDSNELLRDVAVTYHQICGVHMALDDLVSAARNCESMQGLYMRLFESDAANAQAARDLALGYDMLYRLASARTRWTEAAAAASDEIALREDLLDRSPDDVVNRRDWARALIRRCDASSRGGSPRGEDCQLGRSVLLDLRDAGVTNEIDEELILLAEGASA